MSSSSYPSIDQCDNRLSGNQNQIRDATSYSQQAIPFEIRRERLPNFSSANPSGGTSSAFAGNGHNINTSSQSENSFPTELPRCSAGQIHENSSFDCRTNYGFNNLNAANFHSMTINSMLPTSGVQIFDGVVGIDNCSSRNLNHRVNSFPQQGIPLGNHGRLQNITQSIAAATTSGGCNDFSRKNENHPIPMLPSAVHNDNSQQKYHHYDEPNSFSSGEYRNIKQTGSSSMGNFSTSSSMGNFPTSSSSLNTYFTTNNGAIASRERSKTQTRSLLGGNFVDSFPEKLYRLLIEVSDEGNSDIISFLPNGRAFIIHKEHQFIKEIAPKYFRFSKFSSFQRQLNLYDFQRIKSGPDVGAYYHPNFIFGKPELSTQILRNTKTKQK